ncbi:MAG: TolC family protein [Acidobacteriota bacterium]|nr:TolC family protein [Acidobacteriota bacterium]
MSRLWQRSVILFFLSFSTAVQAQPPLRLTLAEAIHRGLQSNLGVLLSQERTAQAAATAVRRQSLLLPHISVEAPVAVQSRSLAAMGISIPQMHLPDVVGPFSTYDVHAYASQPIVDLQSLHTLRSSRLALAAARADGQDARDLVIRNVAALYLNAQAAAALSVAAQTRVDTAQALEKLAADQRAAGVATGIDLLRAQVQTATERQSLVQSRNAAQSALLQLARSIGLEPGAPLELAETLDFRDVAARAAEGLAGALSAPSGRQRQLWRHRAQSRFHQRHRHGTALALHHCL